MLRVEEAPRTEAGGAKCLRTQRATGQEGRRTVLGPEGPACRVGVLASRQALGMACTLESQSALFPDQADQHGLKALTVWVQIPAVSQAVWLWAVP